MHGRLKVRTSEEQRLIKEKEEQKKVKFYREGIQTVQEAKGKCIYTEEVTSLAAQILLMNPDVYTIWNYRKEMILSLKTGLKPDELNDQDFDCFKKELTLTQDCLVRQPKSYSTWHHRYWVLNQHPAPDWSKEFDLCNKYLSYDDRNFHCWDYRRLIVNKIGISLSDEIAFSTRCIRESFSNYSSWHYRSTLLQGSEFAKLARDEIDLVIKAVYTSPQDSSPWFYLRWILNHSGLADDVINLLRESLCILEGLEPSCKWVILAKVWLPCDGATDDRTECYHRLLVLDSMRRNYYEDCINALKTDEKTCKE